MTYGGAGGGIARDLAGRALGGALAAEGGRYLLASAVALSADIVLYSLLLRSELVAPAGAGAAGYGCGLMIHYLLSAGWVFKSRSGNCSLRTFAKFVVSGLLGLILTAGIIGALTRAELCGPYSAKILAIGVAYSAVFLMRRVYVFGAPVRFR